MKGYHLIIAFAITAFLLPFTGSYAQDFKSNYIPIRDFKADAALIEQISEEFLHSDFNHDDRKVKKQVLELFREQSDYFTKLDDNSRVMHKGTITQYLNELIKRIVAGNPELQKYNYKIFTYRTGVPNASNYGQGVIMVHLGLLYKLESEAELAYILCHELAHDIEQHVYTGVVGKAEFINSDKFQAELKKIQKQEYNQRAAYEQLAKKYLSKFSEHSQDHELEADSIGLRLFYNAGYSPMDAIKVIMKLDSIDLPLYTNSVNFKSHFDFPEAPFNDNWLNEGNQTGLLGGNLDKYKIPDSLKTHPHCIVRSESLEEVIKTRNMQAKQVAPVAKDFTLYSNIARFEIIEHFLQEEQYSKALYYAVQLSEQYPENEYLKNVIANSLYEIYAAQLKHRFSYVVDFKDEHYPPQYNQFLTFLHNLRSKEIKSLVEQYYAKNIQGNTGDPYAGYISLLVKSIDGNAETLAKEYESTHGKNYYQSLLEKKFTVTSK